MQTASHPIRCYPYQYLGWGHCSLQLGFSELEWETTLQAQSSMLGLNWSENTAHLWVTHERDEALLNQMPFVSLHLHLKL